MSLAAQINRSRTILKEYLKEEWDVSAITDYSDKDISDIYSQKVPKSPSLFFGEASACNFTLEHLQIPSHHLHVIYYNFGELHGPPQKVTKTCSEKLQKLYDDGSIEKDDSLIVIFQIPITENIKKAIEDLYIQGQETLKLTHLRDEVTGENEVLGDASFGLGYFRAVHAFSLSHLQFDIRKHERVSHHRLIRDKTEINEILEKTNTTLSQLPAILRTDIQAKVMRMTPNDVCEITRESRVGDVHSYRVCI